MLVVVLVDVRSLEVNQSARITARIKPAVKIPRINPQQNDAEQQGRNDFHAHRDLQNINIID